MGSDVLKCHFSVTRLLQRSFCLHPVKFVKHLSSWSCFLVCDLFMWVNFLMPNSRTSQLILLVEFHTLTVIFHLPVSCEHFQFYPVCPVLAVLSSFVPSSGLMCILSSLSICVINENIEMIREQSSVFLHVDTSLITPLRHIPPVGNSVSHTALFKLVLPFTVVYWAKTDI